MLIVIIIYLLIGVFIASATLELTDFLDVDVGQFDTEDAFILFGASIAWPSLVCMFVFVLIAKVISKTILFMAGFFSSFKKK